MSELRSVTVFGSIKTTLGPPEYARLDAIIGLGLAVLVSDAPGADEQIQQHLARRAYPNVLVFHNGRGPDDGPRRNLGKWATIGVEGPYSAKDALMCSEADSGLAFWNGRSRGTRENIRHLRALGKPVRQVVLGD